MLKAKMLGLLLLSMLGLLCFSGIPVMAQVDAKPDLTFDLWVLSWDDISVDTGAGLKLQMEPIGIKFNVIMMDDDPMYEGIYQEPRQFVMYEMSQGYGSVPDHVWWRLHSDNIIDWGDNHFGLDNATMDAALNEFLGATPATAAEKARIVQLYAKQNIAYIPLFLSDDTHAIRNEWTNYTLKPGGVFTAFNPETMIFMYDTGLPGTMLFVMAYPSDIGELNPMFYRSERSHWYDMLVYDTLISYDENLDPYPWLAESFNVNAAGTQVNFTIRTGVKWHDGADLTPSDVNFTMYYYKNAPEDAISWSFMQHITSTAIDGQTVVINLDEPNVFALQTLGELYILPEHIRSGIPADDARWDDHTNVTAQTGSGPFKYVVRVPDEYTTLDKFANWWGASNPAVGQLPNIDQVRIDVIDSQDARILAMRAGDADSERYEVFGAYVQTVLNAPELDLVTGLTSQWDYLLGFNITTAVSGFPGKGIADINVRRAMCYAINRQQLINIGRLGFGTPTNSVIPAEFFPSYYHSDGVFYSYNTTIANAILDAAGYLDIDGDGVREFPGATLPP
ncbi:MAG: ABC transporter substrate-binding protein, partial [Promethearchaeota archaeon]